MQDDDVDEVVLNTLLAEGIELPTSLAAATRENRVPRPARPLAAWVQATLVLAVVAMACIIYIALR